MLGVVTYGGFMKEEELLRYRDGKGKQRSHTYLYGKYNRAIKNGFYFEAMMISYNLVEDRLIAMLHYAGVISRDADKLAVTKRAKPAVRHLLNKGSNSYINVKNISVKLAILKAVAQSSQDEDPYIIAVKEQIDNTVTAEVLIDLADRCTKWKEFRNKFVHGLANKNPDDVENHAQEVAETGYKLARELDNAVGKFSKRNRIRKIFRIQ